jgi:hypothetical protein
MSLVELLPPLNPEKAPRAVHKELNVPVIPIPQIPEHMPTAPPTYPAGKAPKTHIPIGYTRPILSPRHPMVPFAYRG